MPCSPSLAPASICFCPFSPFFNLWDLGVPCTVPLIPAPCPPQEQAIALTVMFSSFLMPTAWVLANIHYYRSRSE
uniref:Uncharacterized protein n=1 Tax=Zosterops lateralis melanops TaxID=1220523 RepID=A0A8D2NIR7_ZOSLA